MTIIDLHNGYFKLISSSGIIDLRTSQVHSEAIVKENQIKYFKENTL